MRFQIALCAGSVLATPPVLEQQFHALEKVLTLHDGEEYDSRQHLTWYDPANQRWRQEFIDQTGPGTNNTEVLDIKNNVIFLIRATANSSTCTVMPAPPSGAPALFTIDPSAVDAGPTTYSSTPAENWAWDDAAAPGPFGYAQHLIATVQANPAAGRSPALLMTNSTGQDPECMCKPTPCHLKPCQHTFLQSFENLVVGPMPDWLWPPVPAGCVRGEFASQFALGKR